MRLLIYYIFAISILYLSYRVRLSRVYIFSTIISALILVRDLKSFPCDALIFIIFINIAPLIADRFKKDFDDHKSNMRAKFEETKNRYETLAREDQQQIESNLEREKKLQHILSLYEISKDMSTSLTFEDIFNIFSSTLKKLFRFKISRLVVSGEARTIDVVYQIELGHRINKVPSDDFDRELAKIVFENKKTLSIASQDETEFFRRLSIIKSFKTLIAIPLFAENKISAVLYIEDIPKVHFENFMILAGQFSIQLQKVILYRKVQEMSITDSLTEVSTRRYFLERATEEIRRSMRHKSNLSFLMLDLDHFKERNDKFGHLVGDVVLKDVSSILKSSLREIDIIGRYGGEEFAIVLTGTGKNGAFQVAERIRENIEGAVFKAYDETVSITASTGISVFPDDGVNIEDLIESADKALYKAKESGRNKVC